MATASRALAVGGQPVQLSASVAQTRNGLLLTLNRISQTVLGFGIGFFALSAVLAVFATEAAIAPLNRLTDSIARRGPEDLRPVAQPVPAEMAPLVTALNSFMTRLKTSLSRSEDFIAEAAHRVRTPLATVRTQAEITLRRVDKDENRAALREMIRAIDDSSRAAGQMLDHAMVSFRTDHLEEDDIDLSKLAADIVERLWPLADMRDISLEVKSDGMAPILGDRILIQNALHNLLDNAIKYAPTDTAVEVQIHVDDQKVFLSVVDRGPGFPEANAKGLTKRFARGSNTAGIVGSGLGLTIVDEVSRAHNADLTIGNNPEGGGACVTLCFALRR
jgi:two-component system sensor histidine kinase TctE